MQEDWKIDRRRKLAIHKNGFIVFLTNESGVWKARRTNSAEWIKSNYSKRATMVPDLVREAMAAYEQEIKTLRDKAGKGYK